MTAPATDRLRVVYIAGAQNCGSTLLDAVLGGAPGARSLGEVGGFHRYEPGAECDCRQPSTACGPCTAVAGALAAAPDVEGFAALSRLPLKERRLHWALRRTPDRVRYARAADVAFEAVAAATGATTLVDSSKNVGRAGALLGDSRHDVRVIHLVRDGRGFLRSRRRRAEVDGRHHVAALSMATWLAKNAAIAGLLGRAAGPDRYLRCRYEDLVADPAATLARIGAFTGLDTTGLAAAATGPGLPRRHLYEPRRRADYRRTRLDASRLASQRQAPRANAAFWVLGGFVSSRWGYDRTQSYLDRPAVPPPAAADGHPGPAAPPAPDAAAERP